MDIKFSRYNFILKKDGRCLLYNAATGKTGVLSENAYQSIVNFIHHGGGAPSALLLDNLLKSRFLVRAHVDELKEFRVAQGIKKYSTNQLSLNIIPTMDCNFRCPYCYETLSDRRMSREVQERILRGVQKKGGAIESLHVGWFGGEPLLALDAVTHLSEHFLRLAEEHRFQYSAEMTTNGYLLDERTIRLLLDYRVNFFQVSFDGAPERHNQRRIHQNGSPTFDILIQNLMALKAAPDPFKVSLRIHTDKDNLRGMPELLDLLAGCFAGDPRFRIYFRPYFGATENVEKGCGVSPYRKKDTAGVIFSLLQQTLDRGLNIYFYQMQPRFHYCAAELNYHYLVNPEGQLLGCTCFLEESGAVGELTEEGDFRVDYEKRTPWLAQDPLEDKTCRNCRFLPLCGGGCVLQRIRHNKRACFHEKKILARTLDFVFTNAEKLARIQS